MTGELYVAGAGLARGYLGRPGLTAERFVAARRPARACDVPHRRPGAPRRRGGLEYAGRADDQVKIRGFRIEPGEIETALPATRTSPRPPSPCARPGPGEPRLAGYAGARPTAPPYRSPARYARPGRARLPEPHGARRLSSLLDALPLTANGKLDRKALPAPELTPPPSATRRPRPGRTPARRPAVPGCSPRCPRPRRSRARPGLLRPRRALAAGDPGWSAGSARSSVGAGSVRAVFEAPTPAGLAARRRRRAAPPPRPAPATTGPDRTTAVLRAAPPVVPPPPGRRRARTTSRPAALDRGPLDRRALDGRAARPRGAATRPAHRLPGHGGRRRTSSSCRPDAVRLELPVT
ncbi:Non-ribosomal peptide synthetase OS=Streptomyces rimosus subsp. rimosus (strain ATCC/ DSM 40260 / JCM 4667 / NRRL 2234) OX=1265868 GN=SRIM_039505 PE=4 SV=1 [Streptomyces rimosus subsp. rimosus]